MDWFNVFFYTIYGISFLCWISVQLERWLDRKIDEFFQFEL